MTQKERNARQYRSRTDNGLCPKCGNVLDREGHYCSACLEKFNEYHRGNKKFYREHHICTECGKVAVFGDDKICPECRAKMNNRRKPLTDDQKNVTERNSKKQQKSLYQKRKEKGICTRCGKRKASPGKTKCGICLSKDAEMHRMSRISKVERKNYGFCYICGELLDRDGGICRKCAETVTANLPKDGDDVTCRNDNKLVFGKAAK